MIHRHRWRFLAHSFDNAAYCVCGAWGRPWCDFISGGIDRVKHQPPPDDLRAVTDLLELDRLLERNG